MKDGIEKLHGFLQINNRNILQDAGKVSHELAVEIAENNFAEYKKIEAVKDTDFDETALRVLANAKGKKNRKK
jgi:hypothetical protein